MSISINSAETLLAQSQIIKENPHASVISQLNELKTSLLEEMKKLTQKHQTLLNQLNQIKKQQQKKPEKKEQVANYQQNSPGQNSVSPQPNEDDPYAKQKKQLKHLQNELSNKKKQLQTLQLRLSLLSLGQQLGSISPLRLQTLQKIFTHYCHYIFKSGRHVTFDRIEYEKSHLIMERFFAFVHDFHLNKYHNPTKGEKQLVPKHQLILIFKKSSSNSRNLELTEFIACIERLAVLKYDFQQSYEERKQKEEQERKRIKEINAKREKQRERRRKEKEEYEERQKQEELRKAAEQEQRRKKELQASQQQNSSAQGGQQQKQQTKQQRKERKKRQKQKKKKKKSDKPQNESQSPELEREKSQQSNQNQNNDQLLNELMQKDASIQNPNEEFSHISKFKKSSSKKGVLSPQQDPNAQVIKRQQLLSLTKEEKVELIYQKIEVDNPKAVEAKLRQYEKPLFKEKAQERKSSIMLNSSSMSKIKETDHNHELKLNQLKAKIQNKRKQKLKLNISRSITDEKYSMKKKEDYEKYLIRSIAINNNDMDALEQRKSQQKKKNQPTQLSLNMLSQSSESQLNTLKLGHNLRKYIHPEEDDTVYLKEYGGLEKLRSSNSSYIQKTPRYSVDIKKRANEVQEQEKKNEEQKLQRFALQMYKNQHYMKRFLERKF